MPHTVTDEQALGNNLREAKLWLKREICKSKREKWKKLCRDLDENIWGKAYKVHAATYRTKISHCGNN